MGTAIAVCVDSTRGHEAVTLFTWVVYTRDIPFVLMACGEALY